ncbi:MAG: ABC transporter permease [Rhizobiaceae bacterium]
MLYRYLLTRLGEVLLSLWGAMTIVFIAARMLGDPVIMMLPMGASPADIELMRKTLRLDDPLIVQYLQFMWNAARGDFGVSFQFQRPAMDLVLERLPATILLAVSALVIGIVVGGTLGFVAARWRGTILAPIATVLALLGQATPVFWLGIILILAFSTSLGWLPSGGTGSLSHLILPSITLATFTAASVMRLLRSSMIEVVSEDFVRTAWSKGLKPRAVYVWHVMRNALLPVVTMVGILAGELLGGAVITETVFAWPGVGRLVMQGIETKDFAVVQAAAATIAAIYIFVNFIVDLLYLLIDPRIRLTRMGRA